MVVQQQAHEVETQAQQEMIEDSKEDQAKNKRLNLLYCLVVRNYVHVFVFAVVIRGSVINVTNNVIKCYTMSCGDMQCYTPLYDVMQCYSMLC